eukprot:m.174118 g.174118  ORF g.174118 m.174118 type:complete len:52 (+) comp31753_c0_seq1:1899-2054(+)
MVMCLENKTQATITANTISSSCRRFTAMMGKGIDRQLDYIKYITCANAKTI